MGFVCDILICVNCVRYHGLVDFNSTVTLIPSVVYHALLHVYMSQSCDLVNLAFLFTSTKTVDISALPQCLILKVLLHLFHHGNSIIPL